MKGQTDKSSYRPLLIAGIAVILLGSAGIAHMMGWGTVFTDDSGDILALDQAPPAPATSEARAKPRCPECGVIVSMREIDVRNEDNGSGATGRVAARGQGETRVKSTRSYEITVRMADGSSRVFNDANPARWRLGERVIVIDGANRPNK